MIAKDKSNLNNSISSKNTLILVEYKFLNFTSLRSLGLEITGTAEENMHIKKYLRWINKLIRQMYEFYNLCSCCCYTYLFTFQWMKVADFAAFVFYTANLNVEKSACSCMSESTALVESPIEIQIWIWEIKLKSVGGGAIWLHCPLSPFFFFGCLAVNNQLNLDGKEKLLYRLLSSTASRPAKS